MSPAAASSKSRHWRHRARDNQPAGKIMATVASRKSMTFGEGGLTLFFTFTAFLFIIVASKAEDAPFAFHAWLAAAASIAAVIAIQGHYQDRPAALPPQEINGRPNYHLGPIKVAAALAVFWGIAGFLVG